MPRTASTFQPYDRATGTELSQKQQEDCQAHYLVIKAYIDGVESHVPSPVPWTRKKLRCPTADLLDAIERLADEIRTGQRTDASEEGGTSNAQLWAEAEGSKIAASPSDGPSVQRYQQAVNLLHELISRLADISSVGLQAQSLLSPASLGPGGSSPSSHASAAFSTAAASRSSQLTASPPKTASSRTSNEVVDPAGSFQKNWNLRTSIFETEETSFKMDPFEEHLDDEKVAYDAKKEKATYDWVLEYLRGGWQSNSPTANADSTTISPLSPLREDSIHGAGIRHLQRMDSDTLSTYSDDAVPFSVISAGARPAKSSRPIPTMASRLRGKVGHDHSYGAGIKSSAASGFEHFKTPKSIMSGGTLFCTPDDSNQDPHPMAQTRYGRIVFLFSVITLRVSSTLDNILLRHGQ